ncbi:Fc.00g087940.m01.CDS01 [Cosmosporella sp. VM-42]
MDKENSNGLGKLLPKSIAAKRRRKKTEGPPSHDDDDDRGRSMKSRETLDSDGTTSTTNMADDERSKSFQSYDSDEPPGAVSAHPSQIGYLTTSSPIVQATHLSESLTDLDSNSSGRSSTFPTQRSDSVESKESSHIGRTKTALLPPHNPNRRSTSPGGKFKGIFRPKKSPVDSTSPERRKSIEHPRRPSSSYQQTTSIDTEPPLVAAVLEPPAAAKIASPDRRSRVQPRVDTKLPPRTPPSGDKPAPVIVNTPPTPVDVSYGSAQSSPERKSFWGGVSSPNSSANGNTPSRAMSVHRRSRSGSVNIGPSKLSNIVAPPLSPAIESGEPTPNANTNSGFFSSMITVAQNAASTLSNNIQNTSINLGTNKKGTTNPKAPDQDTPSEPEIKVESTPAARLDDKMEQKGSAVRTLGAGELSLSQLGLAEPSSSVASPMSPRFPDVTDTRARSESAPADTGASPVELLPEDSQSRPRSLYEPPSGDRTPPPPEYTDTKAAMQRTSSLRSALKQPHRKRGSSVTTGTTIGAAIAAASTLAHPNLSAPKLTGFAIASKKRNRDFHDFFKSVPDDDYLIEDYSCALQREILAHGRLYVSEGHLCFSSNILGWTTTLVMSFDEIVSVEKRSTALVFKNGLMISTLHAKHVFASFTSRDATYDLIVNIWKLGHPTLKSTLNGVRLEGTGGDKTEKVDVDPAALDEDGEEGSETEDESDEEEEEYYDEDVHDEIHASLAEANGTDADAEQAASRKASGVSPANGTAPADPAATPGGAGDFPGPAVHLPTECGDISTHYDRIVGDEVIPAPLGKVFNLLFGAASPKFMSNWLTGDQKCTELQMEDTKGLSLENRSRTFSYIKPLNGAIGPRQTKCIVTETLDVLDYERAANMSVSTQTPDVPSGNVFCVKTRYCLSWAENNATRLQMNCTIEWSGKSWLKGPIEKGANDGQITYAKDLFAILKAAVSTRPALPPPALVTGARAKRKGKNKKSAQLAPGVVEVAPKRVEKKTWGMLEPIRGLLEPLGDIMKPLLTGNVMYGLLVGLLVTTWFGVGLTPSKNPPSFGQEMGMYRPYRMAAYEEMWRREDGELWEWLEERVGLDRLNTDRPSPRQRAVEPRTVEEKLKVARMDEREVEEAIRITEEKLKILKGVMEKKAKTGSEESEEIPAEGR